MHLFVNGWCHSAQVLISTQMMTGMCAICTGLPQTPIGAGLLLLTMPFMTGQCLDIALCNKIFKRVLALALNAKSNRTLLIFKG